MANPPKAAPAAPELLAARGEGGTKSQARVARQTGRRSCSDNPSHAMAEINSMIQGTVALAPGGHR